MIHGITNSRDITKVGAQIAGIGVDILGKKGGEGKNLEGSMPAMPENLKTEQKPQKSTLVLVGLLGEVSRGERGKRTPNK